MKYRAELTGSEGLVLIISDSYLNAETEACNEAKLPQMGTRI